MSPEAVELMEKIREERKRRQERMSDIHRAMTEYEVCPDCAIRIQTKWCGFLWQCKSFICPKCGLTVNTYPFEGVM